MTEECSECGQEPPQNPFEEIAEALMRVEDEAILGRSLECNECGSRLNPIEPEDEQNDRVKFSEEETLTHGME